MFAAAPDFAGGVRVSIAKVCCIIDSSGTM
jgi:hypothetical protein